jgi:hypothetical protein
MRSVRSLTLAAAVLMCGLPIGMAQAAPIAPQGFGPAADEQSVIEHVQFRWAGGEYCWYEDGWRGPGFYRCGYRLRVGRGWGGPAGWHGWRVGGEFRERNRVGVEERGRVERRSGVAVERGRIGVEERGRMERRGAVESRERIGVEQRRMGAEGRARIGSSEQRGRIEGATTGRGGAATNGARMRSGGAGEPTTGGGRAGER